MSVVAVKDGIMAVDSLTRVGDMYSGTVRKWRAVPETFGGGFVAGVGSVGVTSRALDKFAEDGADIDAKDDDNTYLHLRKDGSLWKSDGGAWFRLSVQFMAVGSGAELAMGAMAAGASAEGAAKIASDFDAHCGGPIDVLTACQ